MVKFRPLYFPSLDELAASLMMATLFVVVASVVAVVLVTPLALVSLDRQTSPAKSITRTNKGK